MMRLRVLFFSLLLASSSHGVNLMPNVSTIRQPNAMFDDVAACLTMVIPLDGSLNAYGLGDTRGTFTRATAVTVATTANTMLALGSGVPAFEPNGLLSEPAATNVLIQSDDLTNVAWVAVNMTAAKNATGPDGVANSASTITATAGGGLITEAVVQASAPYIQSAWVKRITGSGVVEMTPDAGVTKDAITVTANWTRVGATVHSTLNPSAGFVLETNGDAIAVMVVQLESGSVYTSGIQTTAAAATRNQPTLTYSACMAHNVGRDALGSIVVCQDMYGAQGKSLTCAAVNTYDGSQRNGVEIAGAGGANCRVNGSYGDAAGTITSSNNSGPAAAIFVVGNIMCNAIAWGKNYNGVASGVGSFTARYPAGQVPGLHNGIRIGNNAAPSQPLYGHVRRVMFFSVDLPPADLQRLTGGGLGSL